MRRVRVVIGLGMALAGLVVAAYPFLSVWRLQEQVLDEVPLPSGSTIIVEGKPNGVLTDPNFVLAYRGVSASTDDVEQKLREAGFQYLGPVLEGQPTFSRACCGSYDSVFVSVFEGRDSVTGLRYSVADTDMVGTWYFIGGFGLLLLVLGLGSMFASRSTAKSTAGVVNDQTPVSAS